MEHLLKRLNFSDKLYYTRMNYKLTIYLSIHVNIDHKAETGYLLD